MQKYTVTRHLVGDRDYKPGDVREADPNDVAHLVRSGVLVPMTEKAAPRPRNKARGVPKNKSVGAGK